MWFKKRNAVRFQKADFKEELKDCLNPGRGWYRLYSFAVKEEIKEEELKWCLVEKERLALVMIDIGEYKSKPLDREALTSIREILGFFQKYEKEMILRFVYDREGKGLENEPLDIEQIKGHMKQIGDILGAYEQNIFLLQGLFIGSWGEMHGTRYQNKKSLRELAQTFWESVPIECFFAVRTPVMWRKLIEEPKQERTFQGKMGFFNDGLFGSKTDLGTYAEEGHANGVWEEAWSRESEIEFLEEKCRLVPHGGEVVGEDALGEFQSALEQLKKMHISYLSSVYDERVLGRWKQVEYEGMSGYDYIGMHLGYRLLIENAGYDKKTDAMVIEIENQGFAPLYEKARAELSFEKAGESQKSMRSIPKAVFESGKKEKLSIKLPNLKEGEEYQVFLSLERAKDGAKIHFANEEKDDRVLLGLLRKR